MSQITADAGSKESTLLFVVGVESVGDTLVYRCVDCGSRASCEDDDPDVVRDLWVAQPTAIEVASTRVEEGDLWMAIGVDGVREMGVTMRTDDDASEASRTAANMVSVCFRPPINEDLLPTFVGQSPTLRPRQYRANLEIFVRRLSELPDVQAAEFHHASIVEVLRHSGQPADDAYGDTLGLDGELKPGQKLPMHLVMPHRTVAGVIELREKVQGNEWRADLYLSDWIDDDLPGKLLERRSEVSLVGRKRAFSVVLGEIRSAEPNRTALASRNGAGRAAV